MANNYRCSLIMTSPPKAVHFESEFSGKIGHNPFDRRMKGATVAALDRRWTIVDGLDRVALLVVFDFSHKQYEILRSFHPWHWSKSPRTADAFR